MSKVADNAKVAALRYHCICPDIRYNREKFLEHWIDLTLDPDSAFSKLKLSKGNKAVELTDVDQTHDDNPKRFRNFPEVLCNEGLKDGKFYWEVDWVGTLGVGIGVSYEIIPRKAEGDESRIGRNTYSWSLEDLVKRELMHDKDTTPINSYYNRVGVYVDTEAGILQYFSVTPDLEDMTLLYELPAGKKFTEALYPGFWVVGGSNVILCSKQHYTGA